MTHPAPSGIDSWRHSAASERRRLLARLRQEISQRENEIVSALAADFAKPEAETLLSEIYPAMSELRHMESHLSEWMEPRRVDAPFLLIGTGNQIRREPKGHVLVLSPWNYPFQLALVPVAQALAAGNVVTLKPSELTPRTGKVLEDLFARVCPDLVSVQHGGADCAEKLLRKPWDHIFFTGSTRVGTLVAEAAARTLSPVTLELGGKSPAFVVDGANLKHAARAITWGKLLNAGQTCVAPDYAIVTESKLVEFRSELNLAFREMMAPLARPITPAHEARWNALLAEAESEGAQVSRFPSPNGVTAAIVEKAPSRSRLLQEEIFGPILPIMVVADLDSAIQEARSRPTPLALYVFGNARASEKVLRECPSGGACLGETLLHLGNPNLPFGGLGPSGLGSYHGEAGFRTFSHERSVLTKGWFSRLVYFFHPPYSRFTSRIIRWAIRFGL